jgi:hypothetical protein
MEEIKLYEGKETLLFDVVAHQYFWNDEIEITKFADQIKKAPNQSMGDAGLVGTQVHNLIEDYIHKGITPEIINPEIKKSFGKFKEWYDKQEGLEIVFTERKVLSRIHKFTGTLDAIFRQVKY